MGEVVGKVFSPFDGRFPGKAGLPKPEQESDGFDQAGDATKSPPIDMRHNFDGKIPGFGYIPDKQFESGLVQIENMGTRITEKGLEMQIRLNVDPPLCQEKL